MEAFFSLVYFKLQFIFDKSLGRYPSEAYIKVRYGACLTQKG